MGRLSEFFRYLEVPINRLSEFKKEAAYIDIDGNKEKYKPIRRKHLSDKKK